MLQNKKVILSVVTVLILAVLASVIELPLPDGVKKYAVVKGEVSSCDIESHGDGRLGSSFLFVGIKFHDVQLPYVRWNTEKKRRKEIEGICKKNLYIEVKYRAQRLLIRPTVTYWVETLDVPTT